MEHPSFFSILPAKVRYDENLKDSEKIFFSEITALSNKYGYCNATNNYFAKLYKVDKSTVSRRISKLKELGHVQLQLIKEGKEVKERRIFPITNISTPIDQISNTPIDQISNTPIDQISKGNSTRFNNTSINRESGHKNKVDCIQKYQQDIGIMNPNQLQQITDWINDFDKNKQGEEIISEAINQSVKEKAKSFTYLNNKLKRYADANVQTLDDAKAQDKEYNKKSYKKDLDVSNVLEGL